MPKNLSDLLASRELQRWRLLLGEAAESRLGPLDGPARRIDHALEWLYGRDPERVGRGERQGGLGSSSLTTPEGPTGCDADYGPAEQHGSPGFFRHPRPAASLPTGAGQQFRL